MVEIFYIGVYKGPTAFDKNCDCPTACLELEGPTQQNGVLIRVTIWDLPLPFLCHNASSNTFTSFSEKKKKIDAEIVV